MFKSIFSKYVTAFMCIILVCFTILSAILISQMRNTSEQMKNDAVTRTSFSISVRMEKDYADSATDDFKSYIYYSDYDKALSDMLSSILYAAGDDLFSLIISTDGDVLSCGGEGAEVYEKRTFSQAALHKLTTKGSFVGYTNLDGFFTEKFLVSCEAINAPNGSTVGYTLVCTPDDGYADMENKTVRVAVIAAVWVMLAALVAVYFITDKIVSPLKEMSHAAKEFSTGKFDTRVKVQGNDEVAELALAFNNMATALEKNEEHRRSFLANVSHDLRTPMTAISGFVECMLTGAVPQEKYSYYLGIISSEVKRLSRLVSSLLDISRLQAGDRKMVKAPFDICEMARQIIISFEQKLDAKKLDVSFECDGDNMFALADRDAIYQVLYNLCDNAVKFSRDGGKYTIKIFRKNKKIFVSVYNEGVGIPADELSSVFDRFYKSDKSRGLDKTGVGLGLYIVKTIIDSHGEEIWVRSTHGEFCEFVFTLTESKEPAMNKRTQEN